MLIGSFAHVHSKDEVLESVLKYIEILARPLVLQAEKHPVTWSHTFMDVSVSTSTCVKICISNNIIIIPVYKHINHN